LAVIARISIGLGGQNAVDEDLSILIVVQNQLRNANGCLL
jgi:hypothetical protein